MNEGWYCPKCGHCYAPWVHECVQCNSLKITVTRTDNVFCRHEHIIEDTAGRRCRDCGMIL